MFTVVDAMGQGACTAGHWVSAWSTAVHKPIAFPGTPGPLTLSHQTIREVVRPTIGGNFLRVQLSNEFGTTPLMLGGVHIALAREDGSLVAGSDRPLTFDGKSTVEIPVGAPMLSDPTELQVPALANIAISIFLPNQTTLMTMHLLGQRPSLISGPGNFTSAPEITSAQEIRSWYLLSDVEFEATEQTSALVAFGDSITDGFGVKDGMYQDWPDKLADRLAHARGASTFAVDNEGIGGNRLLYGGAGVSALARFDRDVLARPGIREVILLEGINDIGWPAMKVSAGKDSSKRESPFADQAVTDTDLILGMMQVIERAHAHGIKVFGATITPYEGADYFTPQGENTRESVNQWIRTSGAFDGVIDFDAAIRDPHHPNELRNDYQSGDHLHPNAAGYEAMAAAINIGDLTVALTRSAAQPH